MEITQTTITEKLQHGWTLRDHGAGWYLSAPRKGYQPAESYPVDRTLVASMEKAGELSVDIPYTSAVATLVNARQ